MDVRSGIDEHNFERPSVGVAQGWVRSRKESLYRRAAKRWLDLAFVLLALPFVVPVVLVLALSLRASGQSPFFSQERVGLGGRTFKLWKLRTMVPDAEERLKAYLQNDDFVALLRENAADRLIEPGIDTAVAGLTRTISTLRHLGRHVVIVAPPPRGDFDIGSCHERMAGGRWLFGAPKGCSIPLASHRATSARVTDFLDQVQQRTGIDVIRFDEFLCDDMSCRTKIGETPLYRDGGHFSYDGSKLIGLELSLTQQILDLAR